MLASRCEQNGSALSGGTVSFDGSANAELTIRALGDESLEDGEEKTATVTITDASGANIGDPRTVTVTVVGSTAVPVLPLVGQLLLALLLTAGGARFVSAAAAVAPSFEQGDGNRERGTRRKLAPGPPFVSYSHWSCPTATYSPCLPRALCSRRSAGRASAQDDPVATATFGRTDVRVVEASSTRLEVRVAQPDDEDDDFPSAWERRAG